MLPILSALAGALIVVGLIALRTRFASFQAQTPDDYTGNGPVFDLVQHLNGPIACEGVIFGPTGRVTSRFVAEMEGSWTSNTGTSNTGTSNTGTSNTGTATGTTGTLAEVFRYDSGTVQHRAWTLALRPDGSIIATAPDVVGQGTGRVAGSGVMLRYRIRLTPEAGGHVLDVTDWMYLMDNGSIMNRSQFRKFGFKVAELVATMRPVNLTEKKTAPRSLVGQPTAGAPAAQSPATLSLAAE